MRYDNDYYSPWFFWKILLRKIPLSIFLFIFRSLDEKLKSTWIDRVKIIWFRDALCKSTLRVDLFIPRGISFFIWELYWALNIDACITFYCVIILRKHDNFYIYLKTTKTKLWSRKVTKQLLDRLEIVHTIIS